MIAARTHQIRIDFPEGVEISNEAHEMICAAIDLICRDWETRNPGQIMWLFGHGALMTSNPFLVEGDHPVEFDTTVEHLEVSSREGSVSELERRAKTRSHELKGPLIVAGPRLLAFARAMLTGLTEGHLILNAADDPAVRDHLERLRGLGEAAVAVAEGRRPA